jgi:hypothetical protein
MLSGHAVRLEAPEHADTILAGESIASVARVQNGVVTISLRRVAPAPVPIAHGRSLFRRTWVRLTLIGVGAALTGSAAILRREGDRWYKRYQSSSDPDLIPGYYDKAVHYDRMASTSLGVGQVAITAGLFLLVTGSADR